MIETLGAFLDAIGWLVAGAVALSVVLCLTLARRSWVRRQKRDVFGWLALSIVLTAAVVIDAAQIRPPIADRSLLAAGEWKMSLFETAGLVVASVLGGFLLRETRWNRLARWCVIAALACALANAPTEAIEEQLTSDPYNYTYVADDQPYRFNDNSSRQLEWVATLQELSENLGAILLLAGIGLLTRSPDPRGEPSSPARAVRETRTVTHHGDA